VAPALGAGSIVGIHLPTLRHHGNAAMTHDKDGWADAWDAVAGTPDALNIAYEALDRHAGDGARPALRFVGDRDVTYTELTDLAARFAGVLRDLGVARGETVAGLAGRDVLQFAAALGAWRAGAVFCPLFTAFGPDPLRARLALGRARIAVTTTALWRTKLAPLLDDLPGLTVLTVDGAPDPAYDRVYDLTPLMAAATPAPVAATRADDPAMLHFTSGTTGTPKGAVTPHAAAVAQRATAADALGLRVGDVYWCTAEPGWVTGTAYGIVAPLALGATALIDAGTFDPARWLDTLAAERVAVWYTAPTALRMVMRLGDAARDRDLSSLRTIASVGEPLNAEVVAWAEATLGRPVHDTWWQTETGAIMLANRAGAPPVPGAMGRPVAGVTMGLVDRGDRRLVDDEGELAIMTPWPSMFSGYLDEPERTARAFAEIDGARWYLTGDRARRDAAGAYWFEGRADDVIKTSGHLVGPFEIERALMAHPAVAEAAAIGLPDDVAGQRIKAFVTLNAGAETDDLDRALRAHARRRLGAALAPKEIAVVARLPHTKSGKIMRRLLKARELGEDPGDVSTLEDPAVTTAP